MEVLQVQYTEESLLNLKCVQNLVCGVDSKYCRLE